jgi:hypothetical protein
MAVTKCVCFKRRFSDLSIRDLRYLMGDRRNKFRISDKQFKPKEGEPQA